MIPDNVLKDIKTRVNDNWPDDPSMKKFCLNQEISGYRKLTDLNFGNIAVLKDKFIVTAKEIFSDWEEIYEYVKAEFEAYLEIHNFRVDGLDEKTTREWLLRSQENHPDYYQGQLEELNEKTNKHRSIAETRQIIDPIKDLLIELEKIVGNECFNGNIQNYSSWGELDSVGRSFRYPVTCYTENNKDKHWNIPLEIPTEVLITGHYCFGANELNIYRALYKIICHLRDKHGLVIASA